MRILQVSGLAVLLVAAGFLGASRSSSAEFRPPSEPAVEQRNEPSSPRADSLERYTEPIPGTLVEFEMMPVPGGSVTVETPDGPRQVEVEPFWIGKTEVKWEAYDVYLYGLDKKKTGLSAEEIDAISRPSKPYVLPGEDFGHNGYPALGMTRQAAREYARWLSAKTDRTYRLPTAAEWKHACRLGLGGRLTRDEDELPKHAWYRANAEGTTHPVGSRAPNRLGVHDMLGNVAEHVAAQDSEQPAIVHGGSYESEASDVHCEARMQQKAAWKARDPQLPKSSWWFSDAPFVGFRLVRTPESGTQ